MPRKLWKLLVWHQNLHQQNKDILLQGKYIFLLFIFKKALVCCVDLLFLSTSGTDGFLWQEIKSIYGTWAVFPCRGAMPNALQNVNTKIFSEWLPALNDYEFR